MKRLLLSLGLLIGLTVGASAQCVGVGSVNNAPYPGMNCGMEPTVTTYVATGIGIVPAASATDIACITGSATKTVRLQRIFVSGTAGTSIIVPAVITKHASANTGGTPATSTALPVPYALDSTNAAASATTTAYTANPTIADSSPGIVAAGNLVLTKTDLTGGATASVLAFDWTGQRYSQAPVLRGVAQQVCVNLNATSPSSGLVNVSFEWTEASQ